jgi:glycosyltransferase involved in cell wall biosynthesis
VHFLLRTPLVIRVGGDFLWEQYVERTGDLLPLPEFYQHREKWGTKEKITFAMTRWTLGQAMVVFNTRWLLNVWRGAYGLGEERIRVIENAIDLPRDIVPAQRKNFLFYSRQITLKNAPLFKRAFAAAKHVHPDIELEEGMVSHAELVERIKNCYAVAVPSVSDVAPNYILDAIRAGKPFLLTKYSGYAEQFGDYGVIVDPLDENDTARGIEKLADPEIYAQLTDRIRLFDKRHTYNDIAEEFLAIMHT